MSSVVHILALTFIFTDYPGFVCTLLVNRLSGQDWGLKPSISGTFCGIEAEAARTLSWKSISANRCFGRNILVTKE